MKFQVLAILVLVAVASVSIVTAKGATKYWYPVTSYRTSVDQPKGIWITAEELAALKSTRHMTSGLTLINQLRDQSAATQALSAPTGGNLVSDISYSRNSRLRVDVLEMTVMNPTEEKIMLRGYKVRSSDTASLYFSELNGVMLPQSQGRWTDRFRCWNMNGNQIYNSLLSPGQKAHCQWILPYDVLVQKGSNTFTANLEETEESYAFTV